MHIPFSTWLAPVPPHAAWPTVVGDLRQDSRALKPGDVFIALQGAHLDGRAYIPAAIAKGAAAILMEGPAGTTLEAGVPVISIPDLKANLAALAAAFYGEPAKMIPLIGVTGTNGKTSCSHFVAEALHALGEPCGLMGTLGSGFYGALGEPGLTTPEACGLQALLRQFVDQGAKAVAMEVSSHSIAQGRIDGLQFETALFTNLTQDHLDYHGDMQTYANVKYRFLAEWLNKNVVINVEGAYGLRFANELAKQRLVYATAVNRPANLHASLRLTYTEDVTLSIHGVHARVISPFGEGELTLPLIGEFNLSNVLLVLNALCLHGLPFDKVLTGLSKLTPVPGRMQTLALPGRPLVVVDYAHTPDALDKVLSALRQHTQGKLVCVFGCGGDRDPLKRPLMAEAVERWADHIIVTNDNPRHEAGEAIAEAIMAGFKRKDGVSVLLNRSKAIEKSIQYAGVGDCVLIAGKGAERYQQVGDEKIPFDDVHEARHYLGSI
jgi:UDP-N-acetylmuramoyl-L-alanyl-D-glutamate--2,6-diaminopimelate ligase